MTAAGKFITIGRLQRWLGPVVLAAALIGLTNWVVPVVPDAMLDYGREVYVPWRITEGEAIYRDIEYFNGPLSPYVHALLFRIFSVSIMTLKVFNLLLVALFTALLYRLLRELSDRFAAAIGCLTFLALFAFAHQLLFAIFNWITPYSYELTHGIMLSFAMIALLWRYSVSGKRLYCALGGVCLGLVLLTKAEVQLAAALAAAGWVICLPLRERARESAGAVLLFGACAVTVVLVAAALLWTIMPLRDVVSGLAGSWKWIGNEELNRLHYFRFIFGTHDTAGSLRAMARWTGIYGMLITVMTAAVWGVRRARLTKVQQYGVAVLIGVGSVTLCYFARSDPRFWVEHTRPLPLFMTIAGAVLLWQVWRHRHDRAALARLVLPMMLVVFSGALMGKILLSVRLLHYGFALAMPGAVLLIVWLAGWLPKRLAGTHLAAAPARAIALGAWAVMMFTMLAVQARVISHKTARVGEGGDAFYADSGRARYVNAAIADIQNLTTPEQTVVVIPDGLIIGYLARRVNPSGHLNFTPPALIMFGEERMVQDLQRSRPDLIVLVHADTSDYDAQFFGRDYGLQMARWISREYHFVSRRGALPFTSDQFGILILRRNDLIDEQ